MKPATAVKHVCAALAKAPIHAYRLVISPVLGPRCRYYPTCSHYALQAIDAHGALKGLVLAVRRILRCHPLAGPGGVDEVPSTFAWRDIIIYNHRQDSPDKKKQETP